MNNLVTKMNIKRGVLISQSQILNCFSLAWVVRCGVLIGVKTCETVAKVFEVLVNIVT